MVSGNVIKAALINIFILLLDQMVTLKVWLVIVNSVNYQLSKLRAFFWLIVLGYLPPSGQKPLTTIMDVS